MGSQFAAVVRLACLSHHKSHAGLDSGPLQVWI